MINLYLGGNLLNKRSELINKCRQAYVVRASDWPRRFWAITPEQGFCQTWSLG